MSNREDTDTSRSIRQAVEEGEIIHLRNDLADEERHRLMTTILANRICGDMLRSVFADEEDDGTAGEGDDSW